MSDTKNTENESGGLKKSLRLIYVYAIAAGAIFTFIGYWDTIFYEYCGAGTFLGFILMTLLILPIAMVYCELAPLFPRADGGTAIQAAMISQEARKPTCLLIPTVL